MLFPESFRTERLLAERLRPDHQDELRRMQTDPEHMAMLGGVQSEEQIRAYLERNLAHWDEHGFGLWMLRDAESGAMAGRALLRHLAIADIDDIEVGYGFDPAFWGRGLATEIARACLVHGRADLGLRTVVAITLPENTRSRHVLEKIGMTHERDVEHAGRTHVLYRIRWDAERPPHRTGG